MTLNNHFTFTGGGSRIVQDRSTTNIGSLDWELFNFRLLLVAQEWMWVNSSLLVLELAVGTISYAYDMMNACILYCFSISFQNCVPWDRLCSNYIDKSSNHTRNGKSTDKPCSHLLVGNLTSTIHTTMTNLAILVRFGKTSSVRLLRWQPHPTLLILTVSSKTK